MPQLTFKRNAHIAYFKRCLTLLPSSAEGHDGNRITIAYFCLSALDLLGALETSFTEQERREWVRWVWALQQTQGGFKGSTFMTPSHPGTSDESSPHDAEINPGHLPSTYTALLILGILRAPTEDWADNLDVDGLERFLDTCADSNGSFSPIPLNHPPSTPPRPRYSPPFQSDARMAYCAAVVDDIVRRAKYPASHTSATATTEKGSAGPRTAVDTPHPASESRGGPRRRCMNRTREWLTACQTWEGGFGQHPGLEAQGGTTYCAITSLSLLGPPTTTGDCEQGIDVDAATRYLVSRQVEPSAAVREGQGPAGVGGFQGRPGKDEDVCYSFWCGAAMRVLLGHALFDIDANSRALLDAQSPIGGFGKAKGDFPDPYHSYLAVAALAMNEHEPARNLEATCPSLEDQGGIASPTNESAADAARTPLPKMGLKPLDPVWNVSTETRRYMEECLRGIFLRRYAGQGAGAGAIVS